jgi:CheY-like chemotaxis protein
MPRTPALCLQHLARRPSALNWACSVDNALSRAEHWLRRDPAQANAHRQERGCAASFAPPLKVLVVEDYADAADALRLLLEVWGHQVKVAGNGLDALVVAQRWRPDVVLCDLGLPGLNGLGVARALRPCGARLLAITGQGGAGFWRAALACGYEAVLTKPADPEELARLLAGSA